MKMPLISMIVLIATVTSGCERWRGEAGATEDALCREWGDSLPTRSRSDTQQTQEEIGDGYAVYSLACPDHGHLVPQ